MALILGGAHGGVGKSILANAVTAALSMSAGADISIIEGCWGMFDSPTADGTEQGSTAQVAQWLHVPVVLIIDAQAFSNARALLALIQGYTAVDCTVPIAGVILNKVGSSSLVTELQEALARSAIKVAVLGAVPKLDDLSSSSAGSWQHVVSMPAMSSGFCNDTCSSRDMAQGGDFAWQQMAQVAAEHIDLQRLQAIAGTAAVPAPVVPLPRPARSYRVSVGVAYDQAFHQYFTQNLHMLQCAGVQLVPFSPLCDRQLPPGLSAVLLGGGAAAQWAEQLQNNAAMVEALRAFAAAGGLVMGEGAGMMYLSRSIQQHSGQRRAMGSRLRGLASCCCQVIEEQLVGGLSAAMAAAPPAACRLSTDGSSGHGRASCETVSGHQVTAVGPTAAAESVSYSYSCVPRGQHEPAAVLEGYTCGTAFGSCVHLHYATCPEMVQHFAQRCLRVDVASATAAASAAASQATAQARVAAAAAHRVLADAQAVTDGVTEQQQAALPGSEQVMVVAGGSRALSAPDLQMLAYQRQCKAEAAVTAAVESSSQDPWSCVGSPSSSYNSGGLPGSAAAAAFQASRKSASIPMNMYQIGMADLTLDHHPTIRLHQGSVGSQPAHRHSIEAEHHRGMPRHPLPFHVPKRWSLELQRLGSLTSQLLPGKQHQEHHHHQQQHGASLLTSQQQQRSQHARNNSYGMLNLPEEAPLSEAAIKLLDSTMPPQGGRTHHTTIGVAVPLTNHTASAASSAGQQPCAVAAAGFGPRNISLGSMSNSSSVHEQMSCLAACLGQQELVPLAGCQQWDRTSQGKSDCVTDAQQQHVMETCSLAEPTAAAADFGQDAEAGVLIVAGLPLRCSQQPQQQHEPLELVDESVGVPIGNTCLAGKPISMQMLQPVDDEQLQPLELAAAVNTNSTKPVTKSASNHNLAIGLSGANGPFNPLAPSASAAGKILSLSPAATDCLVALGLTSRLAGVTDACQLAKPDAAICCSPLVQLLQSIGASWAAEVTEQVCAGSGTTPGSCSKQTADASVVCKLMTGSDGLPRYKLDEDHIRRMQPSLVVVACDENIEDEPHVQHHRQLQASKQPAAPASHAGGAATAALAQGSGGGGADHCSHQGRDLGASAAGQVSSSINNMVAIPGRVRLEVAVVQRVLQRAGILWPEQRAVVLYQRCHSLSEVLEFILVLANAAGVPERGVALVQGLQQRLRWTAARCAVNSSALAVSLDRRSSGGQDIMLAKHARLPRRRMVAVVESVVPLRLAGFWVPEMLNLIQAGWPGMTPSPAEPSSTVSWQQIRAAAPDVLVLALPGLDAGQAAFQTADLAGLPGFWCVPAVRAGAVYACDHMLLLRPGPGLVLGMELLGHLMSPESQPLPAGLPLGAVVKLSLHSGQRCRPRLVPNYFCRYC
eukprot:gene7127-7341_t